MAPAKKNTYISWTAEQMQGAISAVRDADISISAAAKTFDVPRKTLSDKLENRHPLKPGRQTGLSPQMEIILVKYINYMSDHHFPLTIPMAKGFAFSIARRCGMDDRFNVEKGPGKTWWNEFRKRHKRSIRLRKPDTIAPSRSAMSNLNVIRRHFNTLEAVMIENDIFDRPDKLFNVDESGLNLELRKGKVLVGAQQTHSYSKAKGNRGHVTVNCCISAAGHVVPPFIIYEKCMPSGNYEEKGPYGALYGKSPNGYMDGQLFKFWFEKQFIPNTAHLGRRMLIIDGHGSHMTLDVIDVARKADIILYCLPPHTTHILQPLDVSIYGPLKAHFSKITDQIQLIRLGVTENVTICKTEFSLVFKLAFEETLSLANMRSAFAKCGIYPFNPHVVLQSKKLSPAAITNVVSFPATTSETALELSVATDIDTATNVVPSPATGPATPDVFTPGASDIDTATVPVTVSSTMSHDTLPGAAPIPNGLHSFIPSHMLDLFVSPMATKKKKKGLRVVLKERVITSDEYRAQVFAKMEAEKAKVEGKEKRKLDREAKRKKKEDDLAARKITTATKKSHISIRQEMDRIEESFNNPPANCSFSGRRNVKRVYYDQLVASYSSTSSSDTSDDDSETGKPSSKCCVCCKINPPRSRHRKNEVTTWICCDVCDRWMHSICADASEEDLNAPIYTCNDCQ